MRDTETERPTDRGGQARSEPRVGSPPRQVILEKVDARAGAAHARRVFRARLRNPGTPAWR